MKTYDATVEPLSRFCWSTWNPRHAPSPVQLPTTALSCILAGHFAALRFSDVPYGEDMLFRQD